MDKIIMGTGMEPLIIEVGNYLASSEGWFDQINDKGKYVTISGFPAIWLQRRLKREYGTSKIQNFFEVVGIRWFGKSTIQVHKFFLPELIYLLTKFRSPLALRNEIINNTWIKSMYEDTKSTEVDFKRIDKDMNVRLLPFQRSFIEEYGIKKTRCHLRGMILSFDCGLGKTITSLSLMKALGCDKVVIFAPKSTLFNVWVDHLNRFFKKVPKYWVVNQDHDPKDAEYYICNYESMDKIYDIINHIKKGSKVGIITDESHNFLRLGSKRTQNLISLRDDLDCHDCLLQSGTPVKALGVEIMPLLRVIDGFFDEEAQVTFAKAFGVNTLIATDILHARMDMMMVRKTKEEVITLPEKHEQDILVKIRGGERYTITNVKKLLKVYGAERSDFHNKHMKEYQEEWNTCISFLASHKTIGPSNEFRRYLDTVNYLIKHGYNRYDPRLVEDVVWMNKYEKDILMPAMSADMKKMFKHCKSAIKYLDMKIQGEILGYLGHLRGEMTSALLDAIDLEELINSAIKKTILFTSFVDTVETAGEKLKALGFKPCLVYGETSKEVPQLLKQFREDKSINPLVATMQTLATGVTLVEANQVIFINRPWRDADYKQSSDRVFRIGQDTECYIYTLTLDTGEESNLSTSMKDILDWSKEMSEAIVDGTRGFAFSDFM